jgi:mycothiol synthase
MNTTPGPVTPGSATPAAQRASAQHRQADDDKSPVAVSAGPLGRTQRDKVLRLVTAAAAEDGVSPLSEHTMLHLRYDGPAPGSEAVVPAQGDIGRRATGGFSPGGLDLVAAEAGQISGYAHLDIEGADGASAELVIDPARRRRGAGRALIAELAARAGGRPLRVWAHGDLPAAAALARAAGFGRVRALWQMRRSLREPLREPSLPSGISLRTFRPGRDEDEWLGVNARAFASHPEQGAWTRADLDVREQEPWFDPAGFFLAERDGRLAGFHWTKVHSGGRPDDGGAPGTGPASHTPGSGGEIGEVYVVGVDPAEQGTGLGRALTLTGLCYLRDDHSLSEVMLYVDESNTAAIRMYESLGFTRYAVDVMYGNG